MTVAEKAATGADIDDTVAALVPAERAELDPSPVAADERGVVGLGEGGVGVNSATGATSSIGSAAGSGPASSSSSANPELTLVCAPSLLLTTTPGAISLLVDVAPVVLDVVVSEPDGEADIGSLPAAATGEAVADGDDDDPVDASAVDVDSELVDDELDGSEPEPVVSALAKPGETMTIAPMPNAAASAPTRPI